MKSEETNNRTGIAAHGSGSDEGIIRVFGPHGKKKSSETSEAVSGREADAKTSGDKANDKAADKKSGSGAPSPTEKKGGNSKGKKSGANADKQSSAGDEPRRESAIKKHMHAIIAVLLIILTAAACVGIYYLSLVQRIRVRGCEKYTSAQIINQAGLYTGKCILTYDTEAAAKRLAEDPYIKVLSVKKVYPNEISVAIEERSEYAAVVTGTGTYCIIDREGCILYTGRRQDIEGLLPVYGLGTMGFSTGKYINADKSLLRPYVLMELLDALGSRDGEIAGIDLSVPASLKITTTDGYTVMLGDSVDIAEKVERMFAALDRARATAPDSSLIYINDSGSADISYGEPTSSPAPSRTPGTTEAPAEGADSPDQGG